MYFQYELYISRSDKHTEYELHNLELKVLSYEMPALTQANICKAYKVAYKEKASNIKAFKNAIQL